LSKFLAQVQDEIDSAVGKLTSAFSLGARSNRTIAVMADSDLFVSLSLTSVEIPVASRKSELQKTATNWTKQRTAV
jgi:hypothetical protein